MEVNSSPGLEGIEKSTKIDIAGKIMDYIEKKVTPKSEISSKKRKIKKDSIGA
jgi:ribosomal protein S6--L-glutamate ligase